MLGIGALLGIGNKVLGMVGGHFKHKRKLKEAKQQAELDWAKYMAEGSTNSWKDEYLTLLWTLPFASAVVGWTGPLDRLILLLNQMPEWYTFILIMITGASFGLNLHGTFKKTQARRVNAERRMNGGAASVAPSGTPSRGEEGFIDFDGG